MEVMMSIPDGTVSSNARNGGQIPSEEQALAGMRVLGHELAAEVDELKRRLAARERISDSLRVPLRTVKFERPREQAGLKTEPVEAPEPLRPQAQTLTAPVGAIVVPPFDYDRNWTSTINDGVIKQVVGDRTKGEVKLDGDAAGTNGDAAAIAFAAVGVKVKPPAPGLLQISAAPSLSYDWTTLCLQQDATSVGRIGLHIESYHLDGTFEDTVIQTQSTLWSIWSWWSGATDTGSSAGYAIAAQTPVSDQRHYIVWVYGRIGGMAGHNAWWWWAYTFFTLSMQIPYITWVFTP